MRVLMVIGAFLLGSTVAQWRYVETDFPLPPSKLDVAEMVEILADYSVVHQEAIVGGPYAGLIDPHSKKIYISDQFDLAIRRQTVIHEFLHAYYMRKHNLATGGYELGEAAIEAEATRLYEELFVPKMEEK